MYEDIPPVKPRVREFVNGYGECLDCGRRVCARHPLQTSNAQGAVGRVHIGPVAIGLAAHLKIVGGMSYEKIQVVMEQVLGFKLARSSVCRAVTRLAQKAEPTYRQLIEQIRASPVVYPDETGWKLGGHRAWLWAFTNLKLTVCGGGATPKRRRSSGRSTAASWPPTVGRPTSASSGRRCKPATLTCCGVAARSWRLPHAAPCASLAR